MPDEVIRSISTDGIRRPTSSASSTSAAVGAPNVVPRAAAAWTASSTEFKKIRMLYFTDAFREWERENS